MNRVALIITFLIAGLTGALAQSQVTVIGPITPGHCPQFSSTTIIKDGGFSCNGSPAVSFANPTGAVGLTGVNGAATTAMRSDAAPPLSASVQSALTGTLNALLIGTGAFGFTQTITGAGVLTVLGLAPNASGGIVTPTPTRAGDVIYWNGSAWVTLAGNNSGTNCFQENASGVPSFASCASATSLAVGTTTITGGTSNGVLFNNGGVIGNTAAGTQGQQLTSNGSGSAPTFQSGGWVLLNTLTASNSVTLSDTTHITSTYNDYVLVFENIIPATNSVNCEILVHTGGAFPVTGYGTSDLRVNTGTSAGSAPTTFIPCDNNNSGLTTTQSGVSGEITLYAASQTTSPKNWNGSFASVNGTATAIVSGAYTGANTAIDGFQVLMSSGNITSGTVKLYGRL